MSKRSIRGGMSMAKLRDRFKTPKGRLPYVRDLELWARAVLVIAAAAVVAWMIGSAEAMDWALIERLTD